LKIRERSFAPPGHLARFDSDNARKRLQAAFNAGDPEGAETHHVEPCFAYRFQQPGESEEESTMAGLVGIALPRTSSTSV